MAEIGGFWRRTYSFELCSLSKEVNKAKKLKINILKWADHVISNKKDGISKVFTLNNLKIKVYETIILSVLLYDCETGSLTLRRDAD